MVSYAINWFLIIKSRSFILLAIINLLLFNVNNANYVVIQEIVMYSQIFVLLLIWTCHVQKQRFNHSWHLHFVKPSFFARNKLFQNNRSPQSHTTNTIVLCPLEIYIVTCKWGFDIFCMKMYNTYCVKLTIISTGNTLS